MCWYSADHFGQESVQAEVGQRLCIRKMSWDITNWVVREHDQDKRPTPVCLLDGTHVVFRMSEPEQASMQLGPEPEAVFRMLRNPKRDVFEFEAGRQQIEVNRLPSGLLFDVLIVPGKEHLSTLVDANAVSEDASAPPADEESLFARIARFW